MKRIRELQRSSFADKKVNLYEITDLIIEQQNMHVTECFLQKRI